MSRLAVVCQWALVAFNISSDRVAAKSHLMNIFIGNITQRVKYDCYTNLYEPHEPQFSYFMKEFLKLGLLFERNTHFLLSQYPEVELWPMAGLTPLQNPHPQESLNSDNMCCHVTGLKCYFTTAEPWHFWTLEVCVCVWRGGSRQKKMQHFSQWDGVHVSWSHIFRTSHA